MPVRDVRRCADGVFEVAEKRAFEARDGLGLYAAGARLVKFMGETSEELWKETYAQSTPAQNVSSKAEDRTARRTF